MTNVLLQKPLLLNSLGDKTQDLYFSEKNSEVSLIEATCNYQNLITVAGAGYGTSNSVQLPIDQFVSTVILHVAIPNTIANQSICRGWLARLLSSVTVSMGAQGSMSTTLSGDGIIQAILAQCGSREKRSEILELAGQFQLGIPGADPNRVPGYRADNNMHAYLMIPTPFSSACNDLKLPFDTSILSNPITIQLQFNQSNSVFSGTAAMPTGSFPTCEIILRQQKLTNQADSIRTELVADPNLMYAYPFIHFQSFESPIFRGEQGPATKCQVQLSQFANADIYGVYFWVVAERNRSWADVNYTTASPYVTDAIRDISVKYNGLTLFQFPGGSAQLANMLMNGQDSALFDYNRLNARAGFVGVAPVATTGSLVYCDFSRKRGACTETMMQNVQRIPSQQLTVEFNTEYQDISYRLYALYSYSAVVLCQNGLTTIEF